MTEILEINLARWLNEHLRYGEGKFPGKLRLSKSGLRLTKGSFDFGSAKNALRPLRMTLKKIVAMIDAGCDITAVHVSGVLEFS